ncbi:MAG: hypothetical protein WA906_07590, partial [Pacificimonas sp.]
MTQEKSASGGFGSLSGSLLARKGGAKPAMRPQAYRFDEGDESAADDDCGWNDMGSADAEDGFGADMLTPEQREQLLPDATETNVVEAFPADESGDETVPAVVEQQRALAEELVTPEEKATQEAEQAAFLAQLQRDSTPDDPLSAPEPEPAPR